MPVGLDLTQLQKDLKTAQKDLQTFGGQKKIINLAGLLGSEAEFDKLKKHLVELKEAQVSITDAGIKYGKKQVDSIKLAQSAIKQYKRELAALARYEERPTGRTGKDGKPIMQKVFAGYQDEVTAGGLIKKIQTLKSWIDATKATAKELGNIGFIDIDREANKIKNLRSRINTEMKGIRAEMAGLSETEPRDLLRREQLLGRLIALQEKYNSTYKRMSTQKQQEVTDLRAQRDAIRLKQKESEIQTKINSLNQERANARNLNRRIDQIRQERVAIGKLILAYENLINKQRKYGGDPTSNQAILTKLRQEHIAYKNLEREELSRMKALNQNNSLFNDQGRILGKLRTLASRYVSIFTIGNLANKIIETTGYFEKQQVALEGIVGSATKAAEIMNQIKAFAPNSPFQTRQLVDYIKRLAAFSIPTDKLFSTTKQLADLSAGLGVDMERIILAYGQVNAAAVLRGQELRQFTEAGIPMVEELRKKLSELRGEYVSQGQVFEAISKRQVSFQMVADVLSNMTSEGGKFYKMQENLMNTIYGQREKLKDLWTLALNDIGSSSNKTISGILKMLQAAIKNAKSLINGLFVIIIINSAVSATRRVKELIAQFRLLGTAGVSPWGAIAVGAGLVVAWVKKLWDENHKIKKQFEDIHNSLQKQVRNSIKGLDELIYKLSSAGKGTKAYQDAFDTLTANYSQYVEITDEYVKSLINEVNVYNNLVEAITKYNSALEKKQQLEQTKATMGESFAFKEWKNEGLRNFMIPGNTNWFGFEAGFKKQYDMDYDEANSMFEDVIRNILNTMSDKNLLSISENTKVREKENKEVFLNLLPNAMKRGGLGKIFENIPEEGIEELWKRFNMHSFEDNDSRRAYASYRQLRREERGQGSSDFAWLSRIENTFKDLPTTLPRELENASAQEYSRRYNTRWIQELLNYLENGPDFNGRIVTDKNGNLIPAAQTELNALIEKMREEINDFDEASISKLTQSLEQYHKALSSVDSDGAAMLTHLLRIFKEGTQEANDRAAAVRETIFQAWTPGSKESEYARQFLPDDATFNDIRSKLPQTHISKIEDLAKYGITVDGTETIPTKRYKIDESRVHSELDKAEIERLKMEERILVRLMEGVQEGITITAQGTNGQVLQAQMFDIMDREKNFTGGGGHEREFPDFFNIFKNAYDQYKRAAQQGGIANAINEFRSNPTLRSQYGDMFGIEGSIKEFGFKIGDKTVAQIIEDNLIKGGLEDGVVDFKKAAQETAKTLLDYGRANEKERGAYIRLGEQIQKWVTETFTKDTITTWLDEFGKSVQNLTVSFDYMRSNIDLARKMSEQGTLGSFASVVGLAGETDITKPQSAVQRDYIAGLLSKYNSFSASTAVNGSMPDLFKLGDINSLSDIESTIKRLNGILLDVNNEAFKALPQGEAIVKELVNALKNLDKTVRDEASKISGKSYTGNKLFDAVRNASIAGENADIVNQEAQRIAQSNGLSVDLMAIKARVETAQKGASDVLSAYLEANNFDAMFAAYRQPIDISKIKQGVLQQTKDLPYLEQQAVLKKLDELERNVEAFNAARGDFAPFFNGLTDYRTADYRAKAEWERLSTDKAAIAAGATFNAETNMFDKNNITDPETLAYIDLLNQKLEEVGANGVKLAKVFKDQALNNVKAFCTTAQSSLDAMSGVVKNLVSSVQAVVKAFSKAYDVMNDGENPKWMQDTEAFLGDFAENFEAMIAPMTAVIALIVAITVAITVCKIVATPLLIVMAAVVAAAAILAAIIAAFQQHDRKLEHSIEDLKEDVEAFDRAITNLQAAAERSVGFEKLRKNIAATGKEMEKATAYAEMARLETEKKNTDDDKVKEYEQSYRDAMNEFLNGIREIRDELVSATDDWASQMGGAIRSAFQNGENAARAFRDTMKTMIGDVIENMLEMAILQPLIESALENWTNSDYLRQKYTKEWSETDENGKTIKRTSFDQDNYLKELLENIGNADKAEDFYQNMLMIGDTLIDTVNGLHPLLKDFYMHNSELGTLSGGIESVTEDTARRIEALDNSQLGELFAIRTLLEQYLGNNGGFGDSTMAYLQAAMVRIANDTSLIRIATESILREIQDLRISPSRPIHFKMV